MLKPKRRRFLIRRKREKRIERLKARKILNNDKITAERRLKRLGLKFDELARRKTPPKAEEQKKIIEEINALKPLLHNFFMNTLKYNKILGEEAGNMRHNIRRSISILYFSVGNFAFVKKNDVFADLLSKLPASEEAGV